MKMNWAPLLKHPPPPLSNKNMLDYLDPCTLRLFNLIN